MKYKFPCTRCGICCKQLNDNEIYSALNRGDGVCKNLNLNSNLCEIYENRPLLCRIIDAQKILCPKIKMEDYLKLNQQACLEKQIEFRLPKDILIKVNTAN